MAISIHSARVGGDNIFRVFTHDSAISIHSARVGGDQYCSRMAGMICDFNPLRPCGRRLLSQCVIALAADFNPLRPCGRRRWKTHVEGGVSPFQSTPPVWAETAKETIFSSLKHLYYNIFYRKKQENSM